MIGVTVVSSFADAWVTGIVTFATNAAVATNESQRRFLSRSLIRLSVCITGLIYDGVPHHAEAAGLHRDDKIVAVAKGERKILGTPSLRIGVKLIGSPPLFAQAEGDQAAFGLTKQIDGHVRGSRGSAVLGTTFPVGGRI